MNIQKITIGQQKYNVRTNDKLSEKHFNINGERSTMPLKKVPLNPLMFGVKTKHSTVSFGSPVKTSDFYGFKRTITSRHDIFKKFDIVSKKLNPEFLSLFSGIDTKDKSFIDVLDEVIEQNGDILPKKEIQQSSIINKDLSVTVIKQHPEIDSYTGIIYDLQGIENGYTTNPINNALKIIDRESEKNPYFIKDLNVLIYKLKDKCINLSPDFEGYDENATIVDANESSDAFILRDGAFVQTTKGGNYLLLDINDKLPYIRNIENTMWVREINPNLFYFRQFEDDNELGKCMSSMTKTQIMSAIKSSSNMKRLIDANNLLKKFRQIANSRISAGSQIAYFSEFLQLQQYAQLYLENILKDKLFEGYRKSLQESIGIYAKDNKLIFEPDKMTGEQSQKYLELDDTQFNIIFSNVTDIKGNFLIPNGMHLTSSSIKNIDSLLVKPQAIVELPNLQSLKNMVCNKGGSIAIPEELENST